MREESIIKAYITNFEEQWSKEDFDRLMGFIPEALHENVLKHDDWEMVQGSLARKLLLIHGLKESGMDAERILEKVAFMPSGKPYIPEAPNFNLANDGTWAVCSISNVAELGMDLERIKPINLSEYQSQMTYPEWREIYSHMIPLRRFYEFWTIKESVIKADGENKNVEVKDIFIQPDLAFCHARYWYIHPVEVDYNYVCFLVSSQPQQEVVIEEVNLLEVF